MLHLSFGLKDIFFGDECVVSREVITMAKAAEMLAEHAWVPLMSESDAAKLEVLKKRMGILVAIPEEGDVPDEPLGWGDQLIVATISGLPDERLGLIDEDFAQAVCSFSLWTVEETETTLPGAAW